MQTDIMIFTLNKYELEMKFTFSYKLTCLHFIFLFINVDCPDVNKK